MKSFRGERQKKHASIQVIMAALVLLATILLVNILPGDTRGSNTPIKKNTWESSVVQLP